MYLKNAALVPRSRNGTPIIATACEAPWWRMSQVGVMGRPEAAQTVLFAPVVTPRSPPQRAGSRAKRADPAVRIRRTRGRESARRPHQRGRRAEPAAGARSEIPGTSPAYAGTVIRVRTAQRRESRTIACARGGIRAASIHLIWLRGTPESMSRTARRDGGYNQEHASLGVSRSLLSVR